MVQNFEWTQTLMLNLIKNKLKNINEIIFKLNGGRKGGKTSAEIELGVKALFLPYKVEINVWRYESQGADETASEIREMAHEYGIPERFITSRRIKHPDTGNEIVIRNYKSNKKKRVGKLGIKRTKGAELVINIIDEISEFESQTEVQAIYEAISDAKKLIKIESQNPFLPYHWWTKQFSSMLKSNEKIMREQGWDMRMLRYKKRKTLEIYHRSNHRVNHYLSEREHISLQNIWSYDPQRARVSDLGLDGVEEGTIYSSVMEKLFVPYALFDHKAEQFNGGVDWGHTSGCTIATFGWVKESYLGDHTNDMLTINPKEHTIYDSFNGNQEYKPLTDTEKATYIVQFYLNCVDRYKINTKIHDIEVAVDYGNPTFIELLNAIVEHKGYSWLIFHEATKDKVPVRVKRTLLMAGAGVLTINKSRCRPMYEEFGLALYPDNPTASNYRAGADHGQDATEYKVKKNSTRILRALPEDITMGGAINDLFGILEQKHLRRN